MVSVAVIDIAETRDEAKKPSPDKCNQTCGVPCTEQAIIKLYITRGVYVEGHCHTAVNPVE